MLSGAATVAQLESNLGARRWRGTPRGGGAGGAGEEPAAYWARAPRCLELRLRHEGKVGRRRRVGERSAAGVNVGRPRGSAARSGVIRLASRVNAPRAAVSGAAFGVDRPRLLPPLNAAVEVALPIRRRIDPPVRPNTMCGGSNAKSMAAIASQTTAAIAPSAPGDAAAGGGARSAPRRRLGAEQLVDTGGVEPQAARAAPGEHVVGAADGHDLGGVGGREPADQRRVRARRSSSA